MTELEQLRIENERLKAKKSVPHPQKYDIALAAAYPFMKETT